MVKKKRWGKKYVDNRDFGKTDRQLVKRGEYLLDLDFVERWNQELAEIINSADTLDNLIKDEEECYSIAKNEFSSYSLESIDDSGEMLFLMAGKYSGENNCLALYSESDEAYPEICTYLYAYFFSDQPFGYFHCSGSEALGVGESLPDYCYYEVKLPATPKEIKDTATEAVWCIYNSLGWNQN